MPQTLPVRSWLNLQEWGLARLDLAIARLQRVPMAAHLSTGLRGERAALFYLRRIGYTVVAQRFTSPRMRGDIDLIAWNSLSGDEPWLCFVEVKTRTARDLSPAESAVDADKQRLLRNLARAYLKAFPEHRRRLIRARFDVLSVYLLGDRTEFDLFQGAFGWR